MSRTHLEPITYEICVRGNLDQMWADWFNDLAIQTTVAADGSPITKLIGPIPDQSALAGILLQLNDINMPLISVNPVKKDANY